MQAHRRQEQRPRLPRQLLQPRRKKHPHPPESEPRRLHLRRKMIRKVSVIQRGGRHRGHRLESLQQAQPEQHHQVSIPYSSRLVGSTPIVLDCLFISAHVVSNSIPTTYPFLLYLQKKLGFKRYFSRVAPADVFGASSTAVCERKAQLHFSISLEIWVLPTYLPLSSAQCFSPRPSFVHANR